MTKDDDLSLYWFRQDLRLEDNPALLNACQHKHCLVLYIKDTTHNKDHPMGAAAQWWRHHSLESLNQQLNGRLNYFAGDPNEILNALIETYPISAVYWNRCYQPWQIQRDKAMTAHLTKKGIKVITSNGSLLWEPWTILKSDQTPYRVFTPFYQRGCLAAPAPRKPLKKPNLTPIIKATKESQSLDSLSLLPEHEWGTHLKKHWQFGEAAAHHQLSTFIHEKIQHYKKNRDFPAKQSTSKLSPYLRHGELSPNQVWHAAQHEKESDGQVCFLSEIGWREFSYSQLFHFPTLPNCNYRSRFDAFPWKKDPDKLSRWQTGRTGIPIVDAGMRELWSTGFMHNRVRMIVASFLTKNCLQPWQDGADWFWDCLVDADLASNSASWQWVAGCGADAAPYFRIFNPLTQSKKFDPQGDYIRRYLPELKQLDAPYIFEPWLTPKPLLRSAGIELGTHYPMPIVDIKQSRENALLAYNAIKKN